MLLRSVILCGLVIVVLGASSCASVLNGLTSSRGLEVREGICYAAGARGSYDIYLPDDVGPDAPVVVFIHGGNWDSGDRSRYLFVGQSLASAGFVAAIPDYRLYPEVMFPAFVEDAARAVAAVAEAARAGRHGIPAGAHPMVLMGHSAGAHIAAMLTYDERYLRGAGLPDTAISGFVGLAGPYDFLPLEDERYRRIFPAEVREASQPVNFVDGSEPPALLITGEDDTVVEPRNSRALAEKVRQEGGSALVKTYPGIDHIEVVAALATALPGDSSIRQDVIEFIRSPSAMER